MAASKQASKQANIHTHVRNAVPLVWGSLRLAPIKTVNAVSSSGVVVTLEIFFFGLGLTVTEINIKKVQKQDLKNIKNVKRCRDGMPKSMQTR